MSAQIAVLLALTANLFDTVPIDRMADANHAVQKAAAKIPPEVSARFETADKLSYEDRKTIIELSRHVMESFLPRPDSKTKSDVQAKEKS